jgi:hypothetical protein
MPELGHLNPDLFAALDDGDGPFVPLILSGNIQPARERIALVFGTRWRKNIEARRPEFLRLTWSSAATLADIDSAG